MQVFDHDHQKSVGSGDHSAIAVPSIKAIQEKWDAPKKSI
jgi:hypothetical protein